MIEVDRATDIRTSERAGLYRKNDPAFALWAAGYGAVRHTSVTQVRVRAMADLLAARKVRGDGTPVFELLHAADRVASAAMWLAVHQTYARNVYLDGRDLAPGDFKPSPEGHTGGALNMVPAYLGYMAANALTGQTRGWLMGQGHCVSAVDSANLLLGNMTPQHAQRYSLSDEGLTRYVRDYYAYALGEDGRPESPLGSHVNPNTAGGIMEGGYLGFAELQYPFMPRRGEKLVVFLSDGAFEEQRGSDWAPRWWRDEDTGAVTPIMINNGRRIDQRTTMSQQGGTEWFVRHLRLNGFDPVVFDGRDPAAFAWAILEMEERLAACAEAVRRQEAAYPVLMPYGIALAPKGAGFFGEGTNLAHNLPLGGNPSKDPQAAARFNRHARDLWVPRDELEGAIARLVRHEASGRPKEGENPVAARSTSLRNLPELPFRSVPPNRNSRSAWSISSPMAAVDEGFLATVEANPHLRPLVGNPDEMRSNRMAKTLAALKFRVTAPEAGVPEATGGAVVTALNEEAVACAALGNRGGINIVVTYEAFGMKMHGAFRQEIVFSSRQKEAGRPAGWISVPLVLTSHTWENAKNEQSHQDPGMAEAMFAETADVSRVLFPADFNSASAVMGHVYRTHGQVFTLVVPKAERIPERFNREEAERMTEEGGIRVEWCCRDAGKPRVVLAAVGGYQLNEALRASARLNERGIPHAVSYLLEPGRFRHPRSEAEREHLAPRRVRDALFPESARACVFLTHTRPEPLLGALWPVYEGRRVAGLGYANQGGTLSTEGLLFVNGASWAHCLEQVARLLDLPAEKLLRPEEIQALQGRKSPGGVVIDLPAAA